MLKCKDCFYKETDRCHGHGEYYGICKLLSRLYDEYRKDKNDNLDICAYVSICSDDDDCIILSKFSNKKHLR